MKRLLALIVLLTPLIAAGQASTLAGGASRLDGADSAGLPSQTGNSGKYLYTDGLAASWAAVVGGLTAPVTLPSAADDSVPLTITFGSGQSAYAQYWHNTGTGYGSYIDNYGAFRTHYYNGLPGAYITQGEIFSPGYVQASTGFRVFNDAANLGQTGLALGPSSNIRWGAEAWYDATPEIVLSRPTTNTLRVAADGLNWQFAKADGTKGLLIRLDSGGYPYITLDSGAPILTFAGSSYGDVFFQVSDAGGFQFISRTRPTCDATTRGAISYVAGGAGVADTLEVCRKDAADTYAWVTLY